MLQTVWLKVLLVSMNWWLHSVRNAWGHQVRSQQSCWVKGEIRITPDVFALQWKSWFQIMIMVQLHNKAKPVKQKVFMDLACSAAERSRWSINAALWPWSVLLQMNHLSQSWSCRTNFLIHLSDYILTDILALQSAEQMQMHASQMAQLFWKNWNGDTAHSLRNRGCS